MQGEIFDEMIENLSLQAQEEELNKFKMNYRSFNLGINYLKQIILKSYTN